MRVCLAILFSLFFMHLSANAAPKQKMILYGVTGEAGFQEVQVDGDKIRVHYEYDDRGRGPSHDSEITLKGAEVIHYKIKGLSYFKQSINEKFKVKGDRVEWKTGIDSGLEKYNAETIYLPNDLAPYYLALIVKHSLANSGKALAYPKGAFRVEKLKSFDLGNGQVHLYAIHGISMTKAFIWLNDNSDFFAEVGDWYSLISPEYKDKIPELLKVQSEIEDQFFYEVRNRNWSKNPQNMFITNAKVFDSATKTFSAPTSIHTQGNKIVRIGNFKQPPNTKLIDVQEKFVIPGLFDMHTHIDAADGVLHIASGVTTARDLGNVNESLLETKRKFENNEIIGPRVEASGFIDKKGPYSAPVGVLVESLEQGLSAITEYSKSNYKHIKLYSSIEPAWVTPLSDYAHSLGLTVGGHIPAFMTAREAVLSGYDEITHANMLALNFIVGPTDDTRTPLRFTLVGEKAHQIDLKSDVYINFRNLLVEKKIFIDPTLAAFEDMLLHEKGTRSLAYGAVQDHFPAGMQRDFLKADYDLDPKVRATYQKSYNKMLEIVADLHKSGVPIVAGTDNIAGFALHREFELYEKAGISPGDIIDLATRVSAQRLGLDNKLGQIKEGFIADLVFLNENPLNSISNVRKINMVIKEGFETKPDDLFKELSIAPFGN